MGSSRRTLRCKRGPSREATLWGARADGELGRMRGVGRGAAASPTRSQRSWRPSGLLRAPHTGAHGREARYQRANRPGCLCNSSWGDEGRRQRRSRGCPSRQLITASQWLAPAPERSCNARLPTERRLPSGGFFPPPPSSSSPRSRSLIRSRPLHFASRPDWVSGGRARFYLRRTAGFVSASRRAQKGTERGGAAQTSQESGAAETATIINGLGPARATLGRGGRVTTIEHAGGQG